jgi:hypothetical protein
MVKEKIQPFDFLFVNALYKEEFKNELISALRFFTKDEILFLPNLECIIIGKFDDNKMLTKNNFPEMQNILSAQNFLQEEVIKYSGENDAAKLIKQKIEKGRKTIEKIKNQKEGQIEMTDLVGSLSINSTLNIYEIWNISYYAFNDQFKRMRLLEQHTTSLQSIMAGADPKKVKLQDWIQSIQ